jgi:Holliday junction resolvasome RuvABC DNA-binding subunit|tara:strand:+ start:717 stop:980 length:264 start_codon:yes stop_codon:yes gene_type:complete
MSDEKKYIINVNGVEREMTSDEKQLKDQLLADAKTIDDANKAKIEKENTDKLSAKNKFIELGFTEDEIKMIISELPIEEEEEGGGGE